MAATGFTPIQLYRTTTAAAVPVNTNLADGELAINLTDEILYFKNTAGTVKLLAANVTPVANGGTGATTNTAARTNLGATTLGANLFTITNPSAVTFPRFNADNTVSSLNAADFRTAIGAGTGGGSVTSVALSGGTTGLTVSGSPITTSGTITLAGTLAVANGGTGATTAAGALTNLGALSTSGGTIATNGVLSFGDWGSTIFGSTLDAPIYNAAGGFPELNAIFTIPDGALYAQDNGTGSAKFLKSVLAGTAYNAPLVVGAGTSGQTIVSAGAGTIAAWGTLPVSGGGTGATTFTANNVLLGNGTGAFQVVAPGTSGNVLTSDGTTWVSQAAGASLSGITQSVSPFETALGHQAGNVTTGVNNTWLGYQSGLLNTSGTNNTAVGFQALDANVTGQSNVAVGASALGANTATGNVAVGANALLLNTSGDGLTAVGWRALDANTTGFGNIAVGRDALGANTTGSRNVAIGASALSTATTANDNTAVGNQALTFNSSGTGNTGVGSSALEGTTSGSRNTAVGSFAASSNTTGTDNTAVGDNALRFNFGSGNSRNTAVGSSALYNSSAAGNTALGNSAGFSTTSGANNTAVGDQALYTNSTSAGSVAVGSNALYSSTGANNTAVGLNAGNTITTGAGNIVIGSNAQPSSATVSNENTFGSSSTTSNRFWGDLKMAGSNAGTTGQVLTSQGAGAAPIWASASSGMTLVSTTNLTSTTTVDINFSASFTNYFLVITNLQPTTQGPSLNMRVLVGGVVQSASGDYARQISSSVINETPYSSSDYINISASTSNTATIGANKGVNAFARIYNVNTSGVKTVLSEALQFDSSGNASSIAGGSIYNGTSSLSGFRLYWSGGQTFAAQGSVRLYGLSNS